MLSDRVKLPNFFFENFNLDDPGILPADSPSRNNLKVYHIPVTPKMARIVTTWFDSPKIM